MNSLLLFDKYASHYFSKEKRVLEIGPDKSPSSYFQRLSDKPDQWDTLDLSGNKIGSDNTYVSDKLYNYSIPDEHYDIIVAGQVLEHVQAPWLWLTELKRILKIKGKIVIISPTSWPYHEAPVDCWRIYPEGMKELAKLVSLEISEIHWESIERDILQEKYKNINFIEGRSSYSVSNENGLTKTNLYNRTIKKIPFLKKLQLVTEVAFDLVTVLTKE